MMTLDSFAVVGALVLASVAAVTDARSGRIPNWLTLPGLVFALVLHTAVRGRVGLIEGLLGALLCAAVPFLIYRMSKGKAIGGGDLKLFAALGAMMGPTLGLEIELTSFVVLALLAVVRLTFHGKLLRLLKNTLWLVANPFLPTRWRRAVEPEQLTEMRMGPAIAVAVFVTVVGGEAQSWVGWL